MNWIVVVVMFAIWVLGYISEQKKKKYEFKWLFDVLWPCMLVGEIVKKVRAIVRYIRRKNYRPV